MKKTNIKNTTHNNKSMRPILGEMPELLCPAGNMEKLETAVIYGADAVYLGAGDLNLRSAGAGFKWDKLPQAFELTRKNNVQAYFCINAYPREKDLDAVKADMEQLAACPPDGLIIADPGVLMLASEYLPDLPVHISTQANTGNSQSAKFWKKFGASRVNLARELSATDIVDIAEKCPEIELELFVHGAMCMAISGRCFLSSWLNDRSANMGRCTHPCRFEYKATGLRVEEKTRPGQDVWEALEHDGHTEFFAAEDLCLVHYVRMLSKLGIASLKIEGRTKSSSYLAQVVDVYRTVIDGAKKGYSLPETAMSELINTATRPLSTAFFKKSGPSTIAQPPAEQQRKPVVARIMEKTSSDGWLLSVKSRWENDRNAEIIVPGLQRPVLPAGTYSFEAPNGEVRDTVHSGTQAILRTDHPEIKTGLFIRKA
ncbi:peptidase U32 family protein [Maridesulfovibrio hydrothermalis]|uniref:Peptidase U32 n=1 Tax=Maridesulfovibrio hydrothermalis AM13 = DSM 14728 TaxID=1121451 RepID=L0R876_9BACT|nr:peptidase U32 family protein [Maridesulfovibrio hydrothermalis]CCO22953.1 Peptidase U32 [Maridesulfovibrio hydrothermalis AM13 = DSM 14728]